MADEMTRKMQEITSDLLKDVLARRKDMATLRKMTELAKSLGEDTTEIDKVLDVSETFADMVVKRLGKPAPKEK